MPAPAAFRHRTQGIPYPDFGDDFKRVIAIASGLGEARWSGPYTMTGVDRWGVLSDGYGTVDTTASNTRRCGFLTPPKLVLDQDIYLEVQFDKAAATQWHGFFLCGRLTAISGDMYRCLLSAEVDTSVKLGLSKMVANATTGIGPQVALPGVTFATNTNYAIRFQIFGQGTVTLRAKAWVAGTPEPVAWLVSQTDTALTAPGSIGYRFYVEAGSTAGTVTAKFRDCRQLSRRIAA